MPPSRWSFVSATRIGGSCGGFIDRDSIVIKTQWYSRPNDALRDLARPRDLSDRVREKLGHVFGMHWREVFELMTAARTRSDDHGAGPLGGHLLDKGRGDFQREIVLALERAESAGHSATTGIE